MKQRISELLSGLEAPDIDIGGYDIVSPDRIKEMTVMKISEKKTALCSRTRLGRIALIAAALALVLGVSAGAYVGLVHHDDPGTVLGKFFNQESYTKGEHIIEYETIKIEGELYEKIKTNMPAWERMPYDDAAAEKYIYPYVYGVGESVAYGEYTLSVEAVVYDAGIGSGLLYYKIENPNGIEGYTVSPNGELVWPTSSPYYTALSHPERTYIDEAQTTDTKLYACSYFITVEEWGDFGVKIGNGAERSRGEYSEMTILLPDETLENISFDGGNVILSPMGMGVDKTALGLEVSNDIDHISIRFDDGREYIVEQDDDIDYISNSAYALENSDGSYSRKIFNSIIDIDSVVEVQIEEQIFKVG